MANYLKSLTIDGVENIIHHYTGGAGVTQTINVPANTWTEGASQTHTEKGIYLVRARVQFPVGGTTGATSRKFQVIDTGTDNTILARFDIMNSSNTSCVYVVTCIANLVDTASHRYHIDVNSSQAANGTLTHLSVGKMIDLQ